MTTLTDIQTRIAQELQDSGNTRYSATVLDEAVRLALTTLDQRLPRVTAAEFTVETGGRDQLFAALSGCLYIVSVNFLRGSAGGPELEPGGEFTYQFEGEQMHLHFHGRRIPGAGDVLRVNYAARYRLEGLDDAAATTLPTNLESPLVNGAAGHACLLRAVSLSGTYGAHPNEVTRLMEISRLRLEQFSTAIGSLKTLQEFGFPPGVYLDSEDTHGRSTF
jgi:hypothetical protein